MIGYRRRFLVVLILCFLFLLPGCQQNAAAMAQRDAYVSYLEDARDDFTAVDAMLGDKDLDINDTSGEELEGDALIAETQELLAKIDGYKAEIDESIRQTGNRDTMGNEELEEFAKSELRCLELSSQMLDEYGQICNYMITLTNLGGDIESIGYLDFSDMENLEATYTSFHNIVNTIVETLKQSNPPSFFASVNDEFIAIFGELEGSITYVLNAELIDDPLRMDAGAYRIQLLMTRKVAKVITDSQQDVGRRIEKLGQDLDTIKALDEGLKEWIDDNLEVMGALGGGK